MVWDFRELYRVSEFVFTVQGLGGTVQNSGCRIYRNQRLREFGDSGMDFRAHGLEIRGFAL